MLAAGLALGRFRFCAGAAVAADSFTVVRNVDGLPSGARRSLSISVSGLREFNQSTRVSNSGRMRVPYVGVMFVAGMTTVEVEREIARLIKEREIVNEPTVRVHIEQYRAQPTYVIGEVNTPGQFALPARCIFSTCSAKQAACRPPQTPPASSIAASRGGPAFRPGFWMVLSRRRWFRHQRRTHVVRRR